MQLVACVTRPIANWCPAVVEMESAPLSSTPVVVGVSDVRTVALVMSFTPTAALTLQPEGAVDVATKSPVNVWAFTKK